MKRICALLYIYMVCLLPVVSQPTADVSLPPDTTATGWYNLGNAAYRQHNIPVAVLCYERALRLNPADDDAAYNLSLCRAALPDRFATPSEMFFVSWGKAVVYGRGASAWLVWSLFLLALTLAFGLFFRHAERVAVKKVAFLALVVCALLMLIAVVSAALSARRFSTERRAVAMTTTPARLQSTRTAPLDRQIHAGTTVTLMGVISPDSLAACTLPDGTEAWIEPRDYEEVATTP